MDIYKLIRNWFDWCFENPEKINPNHSALYFFCIEHCNRLGWKEKFGFPMEMAKDAIGIKNYRTYAKTFNDLIDWGFIKLIEKSRNQYSANIIAIAENTKANTKALSKATHKHSQKQRTGIVGIDKQEYLNTLIPDYAETSTTLNQEFGTVNFLDTKTLNEKLRADESWIEATAMNLKTSVSNIENSIPEYITNIIATGNSKKTLKDAKSHFNNWYRKSRSCNTNTKERPIAGRLTKSEIDRFDADTARLAKFIESGGDDIGS